MRRFILGRKTLGHAWRFGAEIVNYADDFVICGRAPAAAMRSVVEGMMERLRLPVNARKTRCLRVPEEPMEFLGYLVGRNYDPRTGACAVSAARTVRCRQRGTAAARAGGCGTPEPIAARVGELLPSGPSEPSLPGVDAYVRKRLRQWLCRKHKVKYGKYVRFPHERLWQDYGLERLKVRKRSFA